MKIGKAIPYVLIGILAVVVINQFQAIHELRSDVTTLEGVKPGSLPEDIVFRAELDRAMLRMEHRLAGSDTVYSEITYIPAESTVEYIVQRDTIAMGQLENAYVLLHQLRENMTTAEDSARVDSLQQAINNLERTVFSIGIDYDMAGFCFEPNSGVGVNNHTDVTIDMGARLAYWGRFGAGVHGAVEIPADSTDGWDPSLGGFADYRIPGAQNLAPYGALDYHFERKQLIGILGLHFYWN